MERRYAVWFEETGIQDIGIVGGKNASLGEMLRALADQDVQVPDGFATTSAAYRDFITANGLETAIQEQLGLYRRGEIPLSTAGETIRRLFLAGRFPERMSDSILEFYAQLGARAGTSDLPVAVRSSATAEDSRRELRRAAGNLPERQRERSAAGRLPAVLRLTVHRPGHQLPAMKGFRPLDVALSIGVQRMVRSDIGASGVMFSHRHGNRLPATSR